MLRNIHQRLFGGLRSLPPRISNTNRFSSVVQEKPIKYTDTINLPRTKFPPRLSAAKRLQVSQQINETCFAGLYQWQRQNLSPTEEFVLHDGPPYANGELHMGHAINKILKDVILRQHVINGKRVHYRPGWDCHGLPIELKAITSTEKQSQPLEIRKKARSFAAATMAKQRDAFASWGVMADWHSPDHIYRTMDPAYVQNQWRIFQRLYDQQLVYRDMKPVYWSPSSRTALAEAELEYDPKYESPSLTLRLRLTHLSDSLKTLLPNKSDVFALVWTTTPWSLPANQAVCVNPELDYSVIRVEGKPSGDLYIVASALLESLPFGVGETVAHFVGIELLDCQYAHPVDSTETALPFWAASHVQAAKGTGLVHTAPAHGPDDFLAGLERNVNLKCLVNDEGRYNEKAPAFLRDQSVLERGNDLVLEHVAADVISVDRIVHSYPIDWRTKKPVLIRASDQWFINTEKIKAAAIDAIAPVQVFPRKTAEVSTNSLINQLRKRPYWCISRQRAWGTPIPVFYIRTTNQPIVDSRIIEHICSLLEKPEATPDIWWTLSPAELVPSQVLSDLGLTPADIRRGDDILDIWFDSGVSWSYALAEATPKVADLNLEGIDQFTGWFQSSLMTSVALQGVAPYRSLFVHGFAVDENGLKMSKSLGNVIVPADIIEQYGVDTLRWWVAHHATQHTSIPVGQSTLQGSAECVQKIRATLKYLVGCLGTSDQTIATDINLKQLRVMDKHFLNSLREFQAEVQQTYDSHHYNRAAATILNFVTNDLSAFYLHLIKDRLYCGTDEEYVALQQVLYTAFVVLNKALWPITPHLVEECWSYYDSKPFYQTHRNLCLDQYQSSVYNTLIGKCLELKQHLNQSVRDANTWTLDLCIACTIRDGIFLKAVHPRLMDTVCDSELCELLQVASVTLVPNDDLEVVTMSTRPIEGTLCARCRRFAVSSEGGGGICSRCDRVLAEKRR